MKKFLVTLAAGAAAALVSSAASAGTLDTVKQKGFLQCGSNTGLAGFGVPDDKGVWTGFDVDVCRAIAAAVFNDPTKVKFVPLSSKDRFTALQSGEVDVLVRNSTWTMSRDTALGLNFTGVNYYDGQGFMVRKKLERRLGARAERRIGLHPAGHDDRAEPRGLLPRQQDEVRSRRLRDQRRDDQGLRGRPLRRLHDGRLGPLFRAPEAHQPERPHRSARDHLQGAARPGRPPRRRPVVRHRQVGAVRACSMPRNSA